MATKPMDSVLADRFPANAMYLEGCGVFEGNRRGGLMTCALEEQSLIGADQEHRHVLGAAEFKEPREFTTGDLNDSEVETERTE